MPVSFSIRVVAVGLNSNLSRATVVCFVRMARSNVHPSSQELVHSLTGCGLTMRCTGRHQPRLPVRVWVACVAAVAGEFGRYAALVDGHEILGPG